MTNQQALKIIRMKRQNNNNISLAFWGQLPSSFYYLKQIFLHFQFLKESELKVQQEAGGAKT